MGLPTAVEKLFVCSKGPVRLELGLDGFAGSSVDGGAGWITGVRLVEYRETSLGLVSAADSSAKPAPP